jgi:hypothetical protein
MAFDKEKYKPRLKEYLSQRGVDVSVQGNTQCFNPEHQDDNPSLSVDDTVFNCFGCHISGDIYNAVNIIEGIPKFADQYRFLERFFGDTSAWSSPPPKPRKKFIPDPAAQKKIETWLIEHNDSDKIKAFLDLRAMRTSKKLGLTAAYPESIIPAMIEHLFWWRGLQTAEQELPRPILLGAGIPLTNPKTKEASWGVAGVVVKLGNGFKLHYYKDDKYQKINSKSSETFPMPGTIDKTKPLVLVEGELKAIVCTAAGIENVFSTGGTGGLKDEQIKAYLFDTPEIIICFDNDDGGRKSSGLDPAVKKHIPQRLIDAGYLGRIRIAEIPSDYPDFDPEDLILTGKLDVLLKTLQEAKEYKKPTLFKGYEKQEVQTALMSFAALSVKRLKCLLRKLPIANLDPSDIQPFIATCIQAFDDQETLPLLETWGATPDQLKTTIDITPSFLLNIADKYLSKYLRLQIEKELTPAEELLKRIRIQNVIVEIDFEEIELYSYTKQFVYSGEHRAGAELTASVLNGRMIYVEEDKRFYFFDGHVWKYEPDTAGVIYGILGSVLRYFINIQPTLKNTFFPLVTKIGDSSFLVKVKKLFGDLEGVHKERIHFDNINIKETVTLLDSVMDFTGNSIIFRNSRPEEYRYYVLPYTTEQIKNTVPENFEQYMHSTFPDNDTWETVMCAFSLIQSRNVEDFKNGIFLIGDHDTGKTTMVKLLTAIYKDMVTSVQKDLFVSKNKFSSSGNEATPELAKMINKGAVFVGEIEDDDRLILSRFKMVTGGDPISFRQLHKASDTFQSTAIPVIYTNYLPRFDQHDAAVIRRLIVIPFTQTHKMDSRDTKFPQEILTELKPEFPGIIRTFAEYYIKVKKFYERRIPISKECESRKSVYIKAQENELDEFIKTNIIFDKAGVEIISQLYARYLAYFEYEEGSKNSYSRTYFTQFILKNYGESVERVSKCIDGKTYRCFVGVTLKPIEQVITPPDDDPFA